jgi:hypothetical protein
MIMHIADTYYDEYCVVFTEDGLEMISFIYTHAECVEMQGIVGGVIRLAD